MKLSLQLTASFLFFLALGELAFRTYVTYQPSYYTGHRETAANTTVHYPFGTIPFNSEGFPDEEFEPTKTKQRIGYFGDSVCYGTGAGYGYRVSEILEQRRPNFEHMNFSKMGNELTKKGIQKLLSHVVPSSEISSGI